LDATFATAQNRDLFTLALDLNHNVTAFANVNALFDFGDVDDDWVSTTRRFPIEILNVPSIFVQFIDFRFYISLALVAAALAAGAGDEVAGAGVGVGEDFAGEADLAGDAGLADDEAALAAGCFGLKPLAPKSGEPARAADEFGPDDCPAAKSPFLASKECKLLAP